MDRKPRPGKRLHHGFTLVEVMVASTLAGLIMAGVLSMVIMFTRSSLRLADYSKMESQTLRTLEMLARDLRMAQSLSTNAPAVANASTRETITTINLTIPNSTNTSTSTVTYAFSGSNFTRTAGGTTRTLVENVSSSSGYFGAFNLLQVAAASDFETNQIRIYMTVAPSSYGNYVSTSKRVISARFVLRNKGT